MEMNVLDTLGKLWRHGHGMLGWCSEYGALSVLAGREGEVLSYVDGSLTLALRSARQRVPGSVNIIAHAIFVPVIHPRRRDSTRLTARAKPGVSSTKARKRG